MSLPSSFSHSTHRFASTWKAAQAMVATFCFLVCFSFELDSVWLLKLQSLSISCTRPLRTKHFSSLLYENRNSDFTSVTFQSLTTDTTKIQNLLLTLQLMTPLHRKMVLSLPCPSQMKFYILRKFKTMFSGTLHYEERDYIYTI